MDLFQSILEPLSIEHDRIGDEGMHEGRLCTESRRPPESGPELLMWAVLRDAILCLQGQAPDVPQKMRGRAADEARRWIRSEDRTYAFSFAAICDVIGIEADTLRERLLRPVAADGSREPAASGMMRDLRRARMRGNTRTKVVARRSRPRRTKGCGGAPAAALAESAR